MTSSRFRRKTITALAGLVLVSGPVVAHAGTREPVWIRSITGSPENGFHIVWSQGPQTYTPTRSEALAECGEYDTGRERTGCRATTRTEYRWMGLARRSLRHAR